MFPPIGKAAYGRLRESILRLRKAPATCGLDRNKFKTASEPFTRNCQNLVLAPPPPLRPPPQEPLLELLPPLLHEELLLSSDESLRELPLNQPSLRTFSSFTWPQSMQT